MLWEGRRQSGNVDDRRGMSGGKVALGGGLIGVIFLLINFFITGEMPDPQSMPIDPGVQSSSPLSAEQQAREDRKAAFVKVVLADTEDVWGKLFSDAGETYQPPVMVLFSGRTQSACGYASSASGPFYCPSDNRLYMDLSFADELEQKFGATGEFALAYVVAHEVGHHLQYLMGTTQKMEQLRARVNERTYNKYSVALELQADFLAGVWAHHNQKMKNVIRPEDIESALSAATAIGDDRLQEQMQGHVVPDAFTHGTSAQRVFWFKKGFQTGDLSQSDTFKELGLQ